MGAREATADEHEPHARAWRELYDAFLIEHERKLQTTARFDVSPGDLKALMRLVPGEPRPMRALADMWRCDASTVTWIVDRLERRGLVERRAHEHDRRVKVVALTPRGAKLQQAVNARLYEPPAGFSQISDADLRAVRRVAARLREGG